MFYLLTVYYNLFVANLALGEY